MEQKELEQPTIPPKLKLELNNTATTSAEPPPVNVDQSSVTTDQTQPTQTEQPATPVQKEQKATEPDAQRLFFGEEREDLPPEEKIQREKLKTKWQEAFAKVTKGLGERGIFDPEIATEITHRLIQEVHLSYELYKGDPYDPVCCVDQHETGIVVIAPELLEGIKKPDMMIEQCDVDYVINHELGHLIIHKGLLYEPNTTESFLTRAATILEAKKRGEKIDTTNLPPEMAYVLTTLEESMTNPSVLKGETRYVQGLVTKFSSETDQNGKTQMQHLFEKYQSSHPDSKTTFERFQAHQLKQIAEEMLNERLTCYLASDGTEAGYWQKFISKMRTEDSDALAKCFEAKGVDPTVIEQVKTLIDNPNLTNQDKYDQFQQLINQDQTGKMAEYFAVHNKCFEQFKKLSKIDKEQLDQILEEDELEIDNGVPYYESSTIGTGGSGVGGGIGSNGGESWNDKVWRVVFGVK